MPRVRSSSVTLPCVSLAPVQDPLAVQDFASVLSHSSVNPSPGATTSALGVSWTVGAGTARTVTLSVSSPFGPSQRSVKMLSPASSGSVVTDPDVLRAPLQAPLAAHAVASVLDQRKLVERPAAISAALAVRVSDGLGTTCNSTLPRAIPAAPRQLSE